MKRILFFVCIPLFLVIVVGIAIIFTLRSQKPDILTSPLITLGLLPSPKPQAFIVYGYLPYWTMNKAQFPSTITHVSFFSIPIHEDGHLFSDEKPVDLGYRQFQKGALEELHTKAPSSHVELTLTMMDQDTIPAFLATPSATTTFLADVDKMTSEHNIDGINIDVEYIRTVTPEMRLQFTSFMKALYTHVKQVHPKLHISVAVLADSADKQRLTDIASLAPYTDHIIVMAYDFHRKGSQQSGANAPLYGSGDEKWGKNIMASAKQFTDVVPARKIILGIPFYGYEWSVTDSNVYNFTLPDTGKTATYERITELLSSGKATRHWDDTSFTPYLLYTQNGKQQQIYYEDAQSLSYKIDLVKQANLGGIAIWAMGYEGQTNELWQTIEKTLK